MKKILLDTNAYTALLRGDERILDELSHADQTYISVIVLGELFAGFRGGSRYLENKKLLDRFVSRSHVLVLPVGAETADLFGAIKQSLKEQGSPIPINDIWIAAAALETGSILITLDKHFKQIPGLRLSDQLTVN